jgi:uncharacterized membrane protein HdeD (DUF308 family)
MIMGDIQALDIQIPREIVQYWWWFLVFGIALLLLGIGLDLIFYGFAWIALAAGLRTA